MARVNMKNVVVGVGAGAVDELLEWQDEKNGRTEPFKKWTDWGRVLLTAFGYLGTIFDLAPDYTMPLAQSETTLLTKSVGQAIRAKGGATSAARRVAHVGSVQSSVTVAPRRTPEGEQVSMILP